MLFDSESDLCKSYQVSCQEELTAEQIVGKELVEEHAPTGLEGARSPQADLISEDVSSGGDATLVECKLEFEHQAVGQLLMYDWLLRYDVEATGSPIKSVDRKLVLGREPPDIIPTVCHDLSIDPILWASGGWQSIIQGAQPGSNRQPNKNEIIDSIASSATSSLDSPDEEDVLETSILDEIPYINNERIYREIPVGTSVFNETESRFYADAIGYSPERSVFYLIEVKKQPSISGIQKAIGQSVGYASMFRHDWGLPVEDVIPAVLIDQAPWITNWYRKSRYDTTEEMFRNAMVNTDEPMILMNKVEKYENI